MLITSTTKEAQKNRQQNVKQNSKRKNAKKKNKRSGLSNVPDHYSSFSIAV